ncbi:hypothetical protein COAQ111491_10610 [Comamonas aquatilis]|uniref:hypothetical protein n=1 Tax=Comamonas aquatilis TaxID=1778406 RepID=UPI0039EF2858
MAGRGKAVAHQKPNLWITLSIPRVYPLIAAELNLRRSRPSFKGMWQGSDMAHKQKGPEGPFC